MKGSLPKDSYSLFNINFTIGYDETTMVS